ncbi:hypothetical protein D3C87_846610 [compost metagenome]
MKRFLALGLALSLPLAAMPAHANVTSMSYDARALSLGGSFSAWGNQDINSPLGNPALLSRQRGTFFFGPNLGLSLGNNAVGTGEIQGLIDYGQYLTAYQAAAGGGEVPASVDFPNVLPSDGLRLFAGTQVGLIGLKLGNLGIRSYARGGVEAHVTAPEVFSVMRNFDTTDRTIASELQKLNANLSSNSPDFNAAVVAVGNIKTHINSPEGFGPLMSQGADDTGERKVTLAINEQAYVTTGVTYAQPISNFGILPGKLTAGATVKLFNGIGTMGMPGNTLQTSNNQPVPLGVPGRVEMTTKLNIAQPLTDMNKALDEFGADPINNASKLSEAADKFTKDMSADGRFSTEYTSYAAGAMGTGLDLGLTLAVNDALTVGGAVTNAVVLWPGTKTVYTGGYNGSSFQLNQQGGTENINFTDTEPLGLQVGAAYATPIPGLTVAADLQQNFDGYGPSLQVGAEESLFNLLMLRAGGRFGGRYSFVGGGIGLNLWLTRVDLAAAVDTAGRGANVAASWSLGF